MVLMTSFTRSPVTFTEQAKVLPHRCVPCGKLDSTSNDTRRVLVGDFLNRQLCFHSCLDSQRYSYVNASAHALVNLFHNC